MAITYLGGVSAFSDPSPVTTDALDTTGADCLVVVVSSLSGTPTVTDSKANTWGAPSLTRLDVDSVARLSCWVCLPTSVGTGHTFTATQASGIMSLSALAFAGVLQVAPVEGTNSNDNADPTQTLQTGSLTPVDAGRLLLAGLMHYEDGVSGMAINQSFTLRHTIYSDSSDGSQHLGLFTATLLQGAAAAVNPTWSWMGFSLGAAGLLSLIPAAEDEAPLGDLRVFALGLGAGLGSVGAAATGILGDLRVFALGLGAGLGQVGGATGGGAERPSWYIPTFRRRRR